MEDFQFEVFHVAEAVSLTDQPSDFVVEALERGIGQMVEGPPKVQNFIKD